MGGLREAAEGVEGLCDGRMLDAPGVIAPAVANLGVGAPPSVAPLPGNWVPAPVCSLDGPS